MVPPSLPRAFSSKPGKPPHVKHQLSRLGVRRGRFELEALGDEPRHQLFDVLAHATHLARATAAAASERTPALRISFHTATCAPSV
jgi:hypothetical protein